MESTTLSAVPIEKWVYGGSGLARVEGRVLMTPYVLPGEKADIAVPTAHLESDKNLLQGTVLQVVEPSPNRITPQCPHFGPCGGCHYQMADYKFQLEQKASILRETLQRIAGIAAPEEMPVISGPEWGYRNRIQLHVDKGKMGFHEGGSHRIAPIKQCTIASPRLNEIMGKLKELLRHPRWPNFLRSMEFFTNEEQVQLNVLETIGGRHLARSFFDMCEEEMPGIITGPLQYGTGGTGFRVSHKSFFQVNRFLLPELVQEVTGEAEGDSALELYAGVGLFTLKLLKQFKSVTAVESSSSAVADLEHNAQARHTGLITHKAAADLFLQDYEGEPDHIFADPPRAGLGSQVVTQIVRLAPENVTIVSCDPATHARDLKGLLAGGYEIGKLTLVDLFPQTYHLETVTHLRRKS